MISDPVEQEELAATTRDLIEHNPWEISLQRSAWERTPSGGTRPGPPVQLPAVKRYFGAVTADARVVTVAEGERVEARYVLVGPADDDVQEKDTFKIGNQNFRVIEVHPDRSYETRAWVIGVT